jgi:CheY-like chemotaxis protein
VRYTDSGRIALRGVLDRRGVARIEVEDSGIGIAPAMQARIFDDFFQVAPRDRTHRGGAGLGLGIVRRLAHLLSIPVRIDSTVGIGTRFTIELAASATRAALDHGPTASVTPPHSHGRRIVLVEDDQSMRQALKLYLQLDRHEVHTAGSLAELDELLDALEVSPAIVISDFHLGPHEHGSDAIERIRHRFHCTVPAILLTGDTSAVPARIVNGTGIRMLNKPVDARRLGAVIDELLQPPRQ